jgi:hypothetical protein
VILATVVYNQSSQNLENTGMPPAKASAMALEMERSAGTALPQIVAAPDGAAVAEPLEQAFSDATRYTGFAAAFFILIGLGSSMLLPRTKREE